MLEVPLPVPGVDYTVVAPIPTRCCPEEIPVGFRTQVVRQLSPNRLLVKVWYPPAKVPGLHKVKRSTYRMRVVGVSIA